MILLLLLLLLPLLLLLLLLLHMLLLILILDADESELLVRFLDGKPVLFLPLSRKAGFSRDQAQIVAFPSLALGAGARCGSRGDRPRRGGGGGGGGG